MGRVKNRSVKRNGVMIYNQNPQAFTESFEENKKLVMKYAEINSKKLRNVIAGYVTRLVKQEKELN